MVAFRFILQGYGEDQEECMGSAGWSIINHTCYHTHPQNSHLMNCNSITFVLHFNKCYTFQKVLRNQYIAQDLKLFNDNSNISYFIVKDIVLDVLACE